MNFVFTHLFHPPLSRCCNATAEKSLWAELFLPGSGAEAWPGFGGSLCGQVVGAAYGGRLRGQAKRAHVVGRDVGRSGRLKESRHAVLFLAGIITCADLSST